ncbi:MAG: hypothetical protein JKY33_10660 [Bacteroidia bacterium]|nr:hypothetical protein [Bacteroidia bacterium]
MWQYFLQFLFGSARQFKSAAPVVAEIELENGWTIGDGGVRDTKGMFDHVMTIPDVFQNCPAIKDDALDALGRKAEKVLYKRNEASTKIDG